MPVVCTARPHPLLIGLAAAVVLAALASCEQVAGPAVGARLSVDTAGHFTTEVSYSPTCLGYEAVTFSRDGSFQLTNLAWNTATSAFSTSAGYKGSYTYAPTDGTLSLTATHVWSGGTWTALTESTAWKRGFQVLATERAISTAWTWDNLASSFSTATSGTDGATTWTRERMRSYKSSVLAASDTTTTRTGTVTTVSAMASSGSCELLGGVMPYPGRSISYAWTETARATTVTTASGSVRTVETPQDGTDSYGLTNAGLAAELPQALGRTLGEATP